MAREMQRYYAERVKTQESRSAQIPHELQQLDARLVRLRERLQRGDPDLEPDGAPIAASDSAKVLSMLPKAAALYRKQIDGRPRWGHAGRPQGTCILREMLGEIRLQPATDGALWAEYRMSPGLLKVQGQVVGVRRYVPYL
jgi:hypothetical protein